MTDLGDLSNFMKEGSLANLDWLNVDERDYQEKDTLPKQNLDVVPDLMALWSHQDIPASNFVPNTGEPRTMGDLSAVHGLLRAIPEDLMKTARLAIMQTTDPQKLRSILASRYDMTTLENAKADLARVFSERGLLGRLYVEASDFTNCNTGSKADPAFVRRFANDAPYLIAKEACGDCKHKHTDAGGSQHCAVFHKKLELEVPYSEALADRIEQKQASMGKTITASVGTPKERIQKAFLAKEGSTAQGFTGVPQTPVAQVPKMDAGQALISVASLTKKRDMVAQQQLVEAKARPIIAFLRKEMLKGRSEAELVHALKLSFSMTELKATQSEWSPLFHQAGLYGSVYMTQDSFDDCREGADFINKHASKVRAVIAGSKCGSCIFSQASRCMMYGRKLVASADEVLTPATVAAVIDENKIAGNLPYDAASRDWGSTPVEALKAIHKAASAPLAGPTATIRSSIETAFYGQSKVGGTSDITKREIVRTASQYMNEGLYGDDLFEALKGRFAARDLVASTQELRPVLAEQGLQGIKFIDPTVYEDYGNGCKTASRLHRSRGAVQYLKVGSKCSSCVHQTRVGYCSVINKQLVVEPPYIDKLEEQRAVMASGRSTEVSYESLMNNGLSMMAEYDLQHREASIDVNAPKTSVDLPIEFGTQKVNI